MSRVLFVVPPLAGHVNPAVSVAEELERSGHEVAWAAHEQHVRPLLPPRCRVFPLTELFTGSELERLRREADASRWVGRLRFVWERLFAPLTRAMLPEVDAVAETFQPDVLVADQYAVAGAFVARKRELPWASSAPVWLPLSGYLDQIPAAHDWLAALLAQLEREAGLAPAFRPDLSPRLVIVYTTRALVGDEPPLPPHFRFVGAAARRQPAPVPFPWEALRERPRILVTLGTVHAELGARFYRTVVDALASWPGQVVLVAPEGLVTAPAATMIVTRAVPWLELLPHMDAVVCHGGFTTVSETLAQALPLVVAPIKDDHMLNAENVVRSGAGIRVKFARVQAPELRQAVERVLGERSYREAAIRIATSFRSAGGARSAADAVELLTREPPVPAAQIATGAGRNSAKRSQ